MANNSFLKISFWKISAYLLLIIAGVFVFFHFAEISHLIKLFREGGLFWIGLAIIAQLFTYVFTGLCYRSLLAICGANQFLSFKDSFKVSVAMVSLAQLIPTYNISDNGFFLYFLKKRGLPLKKGLQAVLLEILLYYLSLFGLLFLSLIYLVFHPQISGLYLRLTFLVAIIILFFGIGVFWFLSHRKGLSGLLGKFLKATKKIIPFFDLGQGEKELAAELSGDGALDIVKYRKSLLIKPFIFRTFIFIFDILTLYFLFLAFNMHVYFGMVILVFSLAQAVGIFSIGPGGLGFFEGAMIFFFQNLFVPLDVTVAATLLFRGLSFWLPMPVGIWLYLKLVKNGTASQNNLNNKEMPKVLK